MAMESPAEGVPVDLAGVRENPLLSDRSESASLLKKQQHGASGRSGRSGASRVSVADTEQVSAAVLRLADQGGMEDSEDSASGGSVSRRTRFSYNGKKCTLIKVPGKDYAQVVVDIRRNRKQAKIQICSRVCQLFAFVLTAVGIAFAIWGFSWQIETMSKELGPVSQQALELRPSLADLSRTVDALNEVVGVLNTGVQGAKAIVGGVSDTLNAIGGAANDTGNVVSTVVTGVNDTISDVVDGLRQAANETVGSIGGVLSGNATLADAGQSIGESFTNFGESFLKTTVDTATDIATAGVNVFCGALAFLCDANEAADNAAATAGGEPNASN